MMRTATLMVMTAMLLSGCGLKRNLVLPGHEKHPASQNEENAPPPSDTPTGTIMPAPPLEPSPQPAQ